MDFPVFKDIIMPILGIIASIFMMLCAIYAHGVVPYLKAQEEGKFSFPIIFYLIVFIVIMIIGMLFYKNKKVEKN